MLPSIINLYMIPNLFFSFTVSVSVDLSILNIPYKSISVNLPKYSPSNITSSKEWKRACHNLHSCHMYITITASPLFYKLHVSVFEKSYFIIVLQKISCTRQFESQLSLRSFALSFRVKDCLSTPLHLIGFLNIVTWKHRLIVLIPIFHAGKNVFNVSSKV